MDNGHTWKPSLEFVMVASQPRVFNNCTKNDADFQDQCLCMPCLWQILPGKRQQHPCLHTQVLVHPDKDEMITLSVTDFELSTVWVKATESTWTWPLTSSTVYQTTMRSSMPPWRISSTFSTPPLTRSWSGGWKQAQGKSIQLFKWSEFTPKFYHNDAMKGVACLWWDKLHAGGGWIEQHQGQWLP